MNNSVFLDANVLVYFLDETAEHHLKTIATLQKLADKDTNLYTSHHVIEEVLFIVARLADSKNAVTLALRTISSLPDLTLIEPVNELAFAERYVGLWQRGGFGINDALILQLIVDNKIDSLFSFDAKLVKQARSQAVSIIN